MSQRTLGRMVPLLVGLVVLAVFWPALEGEFLTWDDDENFVHNPAYRGLGWAHLRWMFTTTHMGPYVPLAWVTLGLDYVLWGMDPWGYHLTSLLLHAANAALACVLARRLLGAASPGAPPAALAAGAGVAALAWAVHPLRVESVAWVTERRDVLVGALALLTVLAYLEAWRRGRAGRLSRPWLGLSVALFVLALLAKPTVVGLPLALLLLDVYPLRRGAPARSVPATLVRGAVEKWPFLAASLALGLVSLAAGAQRGMLTGLDTLGVGARLAISAHALAFYLGKTLVPWNLGPLYTLFLPVNPAEPRFVLAGVVVLGVFGATAALARRWPAGITIWLSSVALVLPVVGLLHNGPQIAADRYTYLPALPWSLLPGAALVWMAEPARAGLVSRGVGRLAWAAGGLLLAVLVWATCLQVGVWRDSVTLWRHAARVEPDSDVPMFYLAWTLAGRGRLAEARDLLERALPRVGPAAPALRALVLVHLGIVEEAAGNAPAAEGHYREALAVDPEHPVARIRLGLLRLARGDRQEGERLLLAAAGTAPRWFRYRAADLREAVGRVPDGVPEARGHLSFALGVLLQQLGALDEAEARYRVATRLLPGHAGAWNNVGVVMAQRGRPADALAAFVQALRADPGNQQACANGGRAARDAGMPAALLAGCGTAGR